MALVIAFASLTFPLILLAAINIAACTIAASKLFSSAGPSVRPAPTALGAWVAWSAWAGLWAAGGVSTGLCIIAVARFVPRRWYWVLALPARGFRGTMRRIRGTVWSHGWPDPMRCRYGLSVDRMAWHWSGGLKARDIRQAVLWRLGVLLGVPVTALVEGAAVGVAPVLVIVTGWLARAEAASRVARLGLRVRSFDHHRDRRRTPMASAAETCNGTGNSDAGKADAGNDAAPPSPPPPYRCLVVLLHGLGFNEGQWLLPRMWMSGRKGWREHVDITTVNYHGGPVLCTADKSQTIEEYGRIAAAQIRRVFYNEEDGDEGDDGDDGLEGAGGAGRGGEGASAGPRTGTEGERCRYQRVVLVGHSLGGVVAACIREHNLCGHDVPITHVAAVSSPFHGSDCLAWVRSHGINVGAKSAIHNELMPGAAYARRLRQAMATSDCTYIMMAGGCDFIVRPHSALLDCVPFHRRFYIPWAGHYSICIVFNAWMIVCESLELHHLFERPSDLHRETRQNSGIHAPMGDPVTPRAQRAARRASKSK